MRRLLTLVIALIFVLTLGTAGALASSGDTTDSSVQAPAVGENDVENHEDDALVDDNEESEEEDEEIDEEIDEEQEDLEVDVDEADTDEEDAEEAEEEKEDGLLDDQDHGKKKGWEKAREKFEKKLEKALERAEKELDRLEEDGNREVERLRERFQEQLKRIRERFEEKIEVMSGRLLARGREVKFRDAFPVIKHGRTLIPVRAVTEALGATVAWDRETNTVTIARGDLTIIIILGSTEYTVNGEIKTFDVPAEMISNRTFVPLRYIAEELGQTVSYNPESGDVVLGGSEEEATVPSGGDGQEEAGSGEGVPLEVNTQGETSGTTGENSTEGTALSQ